MVLVYFYLRLFSFCDAIKHYHLSIFRHKVHTDLLIGFIRVVMHSSVNRGFVLSVPSVLINFKLNTLKIEKYFRVKYMRP
jgi:hypothetical protein